MKKPNNPFSFPPILALIFGICCVSTAAIFIRAAQSEGAPSLVIAAYRLMGATVILAPIVWSRQRAELRLLRFPQVGLALLSGFFLALHFATWVSSLEYTTVASSVVLVSTTPLWVALFSVVVLREPPGKWVAVGLALALIGGAVIGVSDVCSFANGKLVCSTGSGLWGGRALFGDLLALIGAWTVSGYLTIGRRLRVNISLVTYTFLVYGMAAVVLLVMVAVSGGRMVGYAPRTYLWFALLALIPQLLGHTTFNWALRYLSASYVSINLLGEPIGSTILAYFILKEVPTPIKLVGAGLILMGILFASRVEPSANHTAAIKK
ncbi:MAG: EamA family transporter [Anaerolineaceae bacterium]